MAHPEYMRIHSKIISPDIQELYSIDSLIDENGYLYIKIVGGMYGIKQTDVISYNQLFKYMYKHGYYPIPFTTGLWAHYTRRTKCCLHVDDFSVKYIFTSMMQLISSSILRKYLVSADLGGNNYLGPSMNWNDEKRYFDISMPDYLPKDLACFQHPKPKCPKYVPHHWTLSACF